MKETKLGQLSALSGPEVTEVTHRRLRPIPCFRERTSHSRCFSESIFPQTKSLPFKKSLQTEYHKKILKGRPRTPTKIDLSLSFFEIQRNFSQTIQAWAYTETPPSFIWPILFLYFGHKNFAFLPDILEGDILPPTKKTCSWGRCSYNVRPPSDVCWVRFAPVTSSV